MSLQLLTDEHISPVLAEQVKVHRANIVIDSIYRWQEGKHAGLEDIDLLRALSRGQRTLLTYDQATIPELLRELADEGEDHAGVIFVDNRTIASNDIGGLLHAIVAHWDSNQERDWTNGVDYLQKV
jgi:hypothetical protein